VKIYSVLCDAPGLPLPANGFLAGAQWRTGEETKLGRIRGGAIVAPKQMSVQGTSVHTVRPVNVDFPYFPVRAGAKDLT
jgi:hypothetical protein